MNNEVNGKCREEWSKNNLTPLDKILYNRLNYNNQDFLCAVVGDKGSGKSHGCINFGYTIDPEFTIKKNVVFSTEVLKDRLNEKKNNGEFLIGQGNVVIIEEGGLRDTASAHKFWSRLNEYIFSVMNVIRTRNIGFFINTPDVSFIDSRIRKLIHLKFEARKENGQYWIKPFWYNEPTGGHNRYPRWKGSRIKDVCMSPLPKDLLEEYEEVQESYKDDIIAGGGDTSTDYLYREVKNKLLEKPERVSIKLRSKPGRQLRNVLMKEELDLSNSELKKVRPKLMNDEEVLKALGRTDLVEGETEEKESKKKEKTKKEKIIELLKNNPDKKYKEIARMADSCFAYVGNIASGLEGYDRKPRD